MEITFSVGYFSVSKVRGKIAHITKYKVYLTQGTQYLPIELPLIREIKLTHPTPSPIKLYDFLQTLSRGSLTDLYLDGKDVNPKYISLEMDGPVYPTIKDSVSELLSYTVVSTEMTTSPAGGVCLDIELKP